MKVFHNIEIDNLQIQTFTGNSFFVSLSKQQISSPSHNVNSTSGKPQLGQAQEIEYGANRSSAVSNDCDNQIRDEQNGSQITDPIEEIDEHFDAPQFVLSIAGNERPRSSKTKETKASCKN